MTVHGRGQWPRLLSVLPLGAPGWSAPDPASPPPGLQAGCPGEQVVNPARLPAPGPRRVRGTERGFRPALPVGEGGRLSAPEPGPHLDDDSSKTVLACCLHRHAHGCACVCACACVCVLDGRERGATGAGARVFQVPTSFLDLSFLTRRRGGWKPPAGPPTTSRGPELTRQAAARTGAATWWRKRAWHSSPQGRQSLGSLRHGHRGRQASGLCWPRGVYLPTGFLLFLGRLCAWTLWPHGRTPHLCGLCGLSK